MKKLLMLAVAALVLGNAAAYAKRCTTTCYTHSTGRTTCHTYCT